MLKNFKMVNKYTGKVEGTICAKSLHAAKCKAAKEHGYDEARIVLEITVKEALACLKGV